MGGRRVPGQGLARRIRNAILRFMTDENRPPTSPSVPTAETGDAPQPQGPARGPRQKPGEIGGPPGPEPTRYGDWEVKGRCTDF